MAASTGARFFSSVQVVELGGGRAGERVLLLASPSGSEAGVCSACCACPPCPQRIRIQHRADEGPRHACRIHDSTRHGCHVPCAMTCPSASAPALAGFLYALPHQRAPALPWCGRSGVGPDPASPPPPPRPSINMSPTQFHIVFNAQVSGDGGFGVGGRGAEGSGPAPGVPATGRWRVSPLCVQVGPVPSDGAAAEDRTCMGSWFQSHHANFQRPLFAGLEQQGGALGAPSKPRRRAGPARPGPNGIRDRYHSRHMHVRADRDFRLCIDPQPRGSRAVLGSRDRAAPPSRNSACAPTTPGSGACPPAHRAFRTSPRWRPHVADWMTTTRRRVWMIWTSSSSSARPSSNAGSRPRRCLGGRAERGSSSRSSRAARLPFQ